DPERKRQREREHREQRSARRRQNSGTPAVRPDVQKPMLEPTLAQTLQSHRKPIVEMLRQERQGRAAIAKPAHDPISKGHSGAWSVVKVIGGFALAVGIAVLTAWGGMDATGSGLGPS